MVLGNLKHQCNLLDLYAPECARRRGETWGISEGHICIGRGTVLDYHRKLIELYHAHNATCGGITECERLGTGGENRN